MGCVHTVRLGLRDIFEYFDKSKSTWTVAWTGVNRVSLQLGNRFFTECFETIPHLRFFNRRRDYFLEKKFIYISLLITVTNRFENLHININI